MIVLKIIGWILLAVLALIVFVLCVKVRFEVRYSKEETSVRLGWLFLSLPLYPARKKGGKKPAEEKKAEPEEEKKPEEKTEEKPKEKTKKQNPLAAFYEAEGFEDALTLIKTAGAYLKTFFGGLCRGVVVDEFYLEMRCTRSDAASTAVYYGEVCAAVFPILGAYASRLRLKKYDVNIYPDYIARFSDASFEIRFHIVPMYFIGILLALVFRMIFGVLLKLLLPKKKQKRRTGG